MREFKIGQRWISSAEPELGIGQIVSVEHRLISLSFDLAGEVRTYARDQAPVSRVRFGAGDRIRKIDGIEIVVSRMSERDGIYIYRGNYRGTETAIIETDLDPNITFSKPEERLFTHQIDDNRWFNLRYETLNHRAKLATLPFRGLMGPRVAMIPHQFYIAREVASRYAPRVLLADEVGLGKTIEAGLIMHQQIQTGRVSRVLVIVPAALTFQWFVEMIRRFNLQFTILDEERLEQIEADNQSEDKADMPGIDNPFEAQQFMLCSMSLFLENPARIEQALEAEWDLTVVDEAHHLKWQQGEPGRDYQIVELLSKRSKGLLLLTATPEQLGRLGHFSRLRLLDADRYHDYGEFLAEETEYESIAQLVQGLDDQPAEVHQRIRDRLGRHAPDDDNELVTALLDRHGTGRVLFRNVRESVEGFRARHLHAVELPAESFPTGDAGAWSSSDARLTWLTELVSNSTEKFLVICSRADTAMALDKHLRNKTTIRSLAFHEHLDLVARDRAANYFADTDRGAQVLVCSEIGSEGRNFQFAHHLVMYDLPESPDLLEQRIGRLDRIGQTRDINIHVPYARGSEQEARLRLFDEGLGIFSQPNAAAQMIFDEQPMDLAGQSRLDWTKAESERQRRALAVGRDRLLELNSHRPEISADLIKQLVELESEDTLEHYMEHSFEMFGLESEVLNDTTFTVKPTESMVRHSSVSAETRDRFRYPELPEEGLTYTYDRTTALAREDVHFLTWENPLVLQALDLVASDVTGNAAVVVVRLAGVQAGTMLLETLHQIDCIAPAELCAGQYLPPVLVRSLITPELTDVSGKVAFSTWDDRLDIPEDTIAKIVAQQEDGIKKMIRAANDGARLKFEPVRQRALADMTDQLTREVNRLRALADVNPNVRAEEIQFLAERRDTLESAIRNAQVRLEAVRLIVTA